MADFDMVLDHVQMPARDPEGLASWYAKTFGLRAQGDRVYGKAFLLVFKPGEPVERAPVMHFGFNVGSMKALAEWADKLGVQMVSGKTEYASAGIKDPEGNWVECYCLDDTRA